MFSVYLQSFVEALRRTRDVEVLEVAPVSDTFANVVAKIKGGKPMTLAVEMQQKENYHTRRILTHFYVRSTRYKEESYNQTFTWQNAMEGCTFNPDKNGALREILRELRR